MKDICIHTHCVHELWVQDISLRQAKLWTVKCKQFICCKDDSRPKMWPWGLGQSRCLCYPGKGLNLASRSDHHDLKALISVSYMIYNVMIMYSFKEQQVAKLSTRLLAVDLATRCNIGSKQDAAIFWVTMQQYNAHSRNWGFSGAHSIQTIHPVPKLMYKWYILGMSTSPQNDSHQGSHQATKIKFYDISGRFLKIPDSTRSIYHLVVGSTSPTGLHQPLATTFQCNYHSF